VCQLNDPNRVESTQQYVHVVCACGCMLQSHSTHISRFHSYIWMLLAAVIDRDNLDKNAVFRLTL